mmetsp:Transcript_21576/g.26126  ORF Transcript_21576/g.26126 Transcript_21576/m.26126 type:complete len:101 (-) Transcript_21576:239-541(-)
MWNDRGEEYVGVASEHTYLDIGHGIAHIGEQLQEAFVANAWVGEQSHIAQLYNVTDVDNVYGEASVYVHADVYVTVDAFAEVSAHRIHVGTASDAYCARC